MAPNNSAWQRTKSLYRRRPRLTLLGRSVLLVSLELLVNAVCWIIAGILFGRNASTRSVLSLALLAWTIGLRHALDADHISAIDNATRSLISMGQLPVTCGLFFSLGHSTIVIAVNVAISISTSVYDHIDGVGNVGGIVGTAVSASFLALIGLANSIILWRVLVRRRKLGRERKDRIARGEDITQFDQQVAEEEGRGNTIMMRILGPIVTFVNRPWKMYPVGVLFGFGFDTASSIALLAVSAIAKKDSNGKQIPSGYIVILPFLFTAGMTLIDSIDSIIMLYSYSGFPDRSWRLFEKGETFDQKQSLLGEEEDLSRGRSRAISSASKTSLPTEIEQVPVMPSTTTPPSPDTDSGKVPLEEAELATEEDSEMLERARLMRVKRNAMSTLSILLTLMSILVAFAIALIEIMGLIGDNCGPCQEAANDPNGGGLAGRWWRAWDAANDASGYIGAAIVGAFVFVVGVSYGTRHLYRKYKDDKGKNPALELPPSPSPPSSRIAI